MDEDHPCEGMSPDSKAEVHKQVQWCPAWGLWLCAQCRHTRNEAEFRATLEDKRRMPGPDWNRPAEPLIRL